MTLELFTAPSSRSRPRSLARADRGRTSRGPRGRDNRWRWRRRRVTEKNTRSIRVDRSSSAARATSIVWLTSLEHLPLTPTVDRVFLRRRDRAATGRGRIHGHANGIYARR